MVMVILGILVVVVVIFDAAIDFAKNHDEWCLRK
jgi:hypothetical protein